MEWLNQIREKIVDRSDLHAVLDPIRKSGLSIAFTNGCFDILHKGHVEYLAQAADLADVLVLGLNSDDSVRRLEKGDDRPVNSQDARAAVLSALGFIDVIVIFDEDTPEQLIKEVHPNVLIKGADYDPQEADPSSKKYVVGRESVLAAGGEVKVIDLVPGFSTTNIVNKLKK
ncbi:MAG: adenylyltransferase/cytidyltransferase family protein [Crocinitomicaceae bacterium]|nr:adenylyltransferase/cytidyltransferase family protein [Crocinitomicaceae bacterium]